MNLAETRWWRVLLLIGGLALAVWALTHASATGASFTSALDLIGHLPRMQIVGLGVLWLLGLYVHAVALSASLPGLTLHRALTLNLTGSAVSNVLPLGGLAGTALNLTMTRGWGHSGLDFARFVVVSKACDVVAKLVMPAVAILALLGSGAVGWSAAIAWGLPAAAAFVAGLLLLWALCGHVTALLRLAAVTATAATFVLRRSDRPVGATWPASLSALLDGTDQLVRRHRVALMAGMTGYWLAQGALLWCCFLAVGVRPGLAVILAALAAERLMTLVIVTPGGTGPAEAGMVATLIALGVDPTGALAGVLLFRGFVFLAEIPVGAAVGAVWWMARSAAARRSRDKQANEVPSACA